MGDEMLICTVRFRNYSVHVNIEYKCRSLDSAVELHKSVHKRINFFGSEYAKSCIRSVLRDWHVLDCAIDDALQEFFNPADLWDYTIQKAFNVEYKPNYRSVE